VKRDPRYQKVFDALIMEVIDNFKFWNSRFAFAYELERNALIPNRDDFLALAPPPVPVPESGLAVDPAPNFRNTVAILSRIHLKANEHVLGGLAVIWSLLIDNEKLTFLSGPFPNLISLEEYVAEQRQTLTKTTLLFKASIEEALENAISATLEENVRQLSQLP
jgi:hypothetical protein